MSAKRVTGHLKLIERREGPVWFVKTRVPGRVPEQTTRRLAPAHLTGGTCPAGKLTRKAAQDALADLLAQERQRVGEGAYEARTEVVTFAQAAAAYLHHVEFVKGREVATIKDYRESIARYLAPRWGETPVSDLRPADVAALRDELLAAGRSPRTVVRHLTVTHGVLKHAVREGWVTRNVASAELVDRPTVRYSGEFDTFDREELDALARAAESEQDATLFLTAAMTGLRLGELLALRWRDIDFAGQRVHVRRSYSQHARTEKAPKSGKVRSVPLVPDLIGPLDRLSRRKHFTGDSDLVFVGPTGQHVAYAALRRRYQAALKRAGLRPIRLHDLRHIFGTTAIQAFVQSDVQAMMGHAHVTTTMRYVHHRPGADDAAKLSRAFAGEAVDPLAAGTQDTAAADDRQ